MDTISKLDQRRLFFRGQSFEIGTDGRLMVTVKRPFAHENWSLPLRSLDPSPTRVQSSDFKPLILLIPAILVTLPCLIGTLYSLVKFDISNFIIMGGVTGIFGLISIGIAWSMYMKYVNVLSFSGAQGARIPLWFNNPTRQKFEDFVTKFKAAIEAAQITDDSDTAADLKMLEELLERGLLEKEQFVSRQGKAIQQRKKQQKNWFLRELLLVPEFQQIVVKSRQHPN